MGVPRKTIFVSLLLDALDLDIPLMPLESPYDWLKRKGYNNRKQYRQTLRGLQNRGVLKITMKQDKEFIELTKKGELKILLKKATSIKEQNWDGKWRVLIFDIPETSHVIRDAFRRLLLKNNFKKLQASVFISPHPLSRDAIAYLHESNLIKFIRVMKVEEMDQDLDLRKKFNLQ